MHTISLNSSPSTEKASVGGAWWYGARGLKCGRCLELADILPLQHFLVDLVTLAASR